MIYYTFKDLDENLFKAVENNHPEAARFLLKRGANAESHDLKTGSTPLIIAILKENMETVQALIESGANPDKKNRTGVAPLSIAANNGNFEIVKFLLENNAEVNIQNHNGFVPLHDAIENGKIDIVKLLISYGANVNSKGNKTTPLHFVAVHGHRSIAKLLIKHGAEIHVKNEDNHTPLILAAFHKHSNVMNAIVETEAKRNFIPVEEIPEAKELCKKAAELRQMWREDKNNIAKAELIFRNVIEDYPDYWLGYWGLGEVLSVKTNSASINDPVFEEQINTLRKAIDLAPNIREPLLKLSSVMANFDSGLTEALYIKALEADNSKENRLYSDISIAEYYWAIGILMGEKSGYESLSLDAFCRAVKLNPRDFGGRFMPSSRIVQSIWRLALQILSNKKNDVPKTNTNSESNFDKKIRDVIKEMDGLYESHNRSIRIGNKYLQYRKQEDLKEAIRLARKAVNDIENRNSKEHAAEIYYNIGKLLYHRFEAKSNLHDLEESLSYCKVAIKYANYNTQKWADYHNSLGNILKAFFKYKSGNLNHLIESINANRIAIDATDKHNPVYLSYLSGLGSKQVEKFTFTGTIDDLNTAVKTLKKSEKNIFEEYPHRDMVLNNLGIGYRNLFIIAEEHEKREEYLEKAIELLKESIELTPEDSPDRIIHLINLGNTLFTRFEFYGDYQDIVDSINLFRISLDETPFDSALYMTRGLKLGGALLSKFEYDKDIDNLESCIEILESIFNRFSEKSPVLSQVHITFADALRYRYMINGNQDDMLDAINHFKKAAELGNIRALRDGLLASQKWLSWAFSRESWEEVELAYEYAYNCSSKLFQAQLLRSHKEAWLNYSQGVAAKAAYALAKQNKLEDAVVAIERGLAQLLSESLALNKVNLEELKHTENAEYYENYYKAIHTLRRLLNLEDDSEETLEKLRTVNNELEVVISSIQKIKGYENFLSSPDFNNILNVATNNHLVYLISTEKGGLALIFKQKPKKLKYFGKNTESCVICKWLPDLSKSNLNNALNGTDRQDGYLTTYNNWKKNKGKKELFEKWKNAFDDITRWLWDAAMSEIINEFHLKSPITLIPVGKLSLLPLHAAWAENLRRPCGRMYVIDHLNISYAPNAQVLGNTKHFTSKSDIDSFFGIDEPEPSKPPLKYSNLELNFVKSNFSKSKVLSKSSATHKNVIDSIEYYKVVHFSCHGKSNLESPLKSKLIMANHEPLTLNEILKLDLPQLRLVTLSACETGMQGIKLPDEVVSLSSGLLNAGAAGVISSLWVTEEKSTMLLMVRFYEQWLNGNVKNPVQAFTKTQCWLRDTPVDKKIKYLKELKHKAFNRSDILTIQLLRDLISSLEKSNLDFSIPIFWGAFIYTGT